MALFEITAHRIEEVTRASFAELKLKERGDLQRLLVSGEIVNYRYSANKAVLNWRIKLGKK